jgi:Domain of unknown function (DUF4430)
VGEGAVSRRGRCAALAVLAAAAGAGGCGVASSGAPSGVSLVVTADFGTASLQAVQGIAASASTSVLALLRRYDVVVARPGGVGVQSIGGQARGVSAGRLYAWSYFINGVQVNLSAERAKLHAGDRVWWDLHDGTVKADVTAVVGSYPEPFVHGTGGARLPVRLECAPTGSSACRTVAAHLHAVGVVPFPATLGGGEEVQTLRVLVGTFAALRPDPAVAALGTGPRAGGIYVRVSPGGDRLAILDPDGKPARTLGAGAGLLAATTETGGSAPVWVVSGTDLAGVQAAAAALTEADLHDRFALAVAAGQRFPAPATGP